ncbi:MAG: hypothetical protein R3258_04980 [Acidimicrobiia bacterium]|nr:hypothetical protein [Acidimicrobiia bacterium]
MRKRISVIAAIVAASLALSLPALAHDGGPCNDSGEPGNSDYAQHHIVPLAKDGIIGKGHKPGAHQGFSVCR